MPYPNEHAARLRDPGAFDRFRRENDKFGEGIDAIWGIKDGEAALQAIRFDASKFSAREARAWLRDHDYEPILFEPATETRAAANVGGGLVENGAAEALLRDVVFEGRRHVIAPVVLIVEGVHNELYYPAAVLAAMPEAWNGVPIPVLHPERNGQPVSANEPRTIEERVIGRLFNVAFDGRALRGELWLDVAKAERVAPSVLETLRRGGRMEVSTGLYGDDDGTPGTWNGEAFVASITSIIPDHLALLPGQIGACSWEDGCGVRANAGERKEGGPMAPSEVTMRLNVRDAFRAVVEAVAKTLGFRVNEPSHDDIRAALQKAVDAKDGAGWVHFIADVFDDYFVYIARTTNPSEDGGTTLPGAGIEKFYRLGYTLDAETGEVTLGDTPVEVRPERTYKEVTANAGADGAAAAGGAAEGGADKEAVKMEKKELIDKMLACGCAGFAEDDRPRLDALSEDALGLLASVVERIAANAAAAAAATPPAPTFDALLAAAPEPVRAAYARALAREKAEKDKVIAAILANARNKFTAEALAAKPIEELVDLANLAGADVDFSLADPARPVVNKDAEAPEMEKVWQL